MIPSDHFVRFYNEVFKFLDERNALKPYYREIGRHQELHHLDDFRRKGLQGVFEYYKRIRVEENCELEIDAKPDRIVFRMTKCPSLSKVLDSDATPCAKYCDHCAGWSVPLYTASGLYYVENAIGRTDPRCIWVVTERREVAQEVLNEFLGSGVARDLVATNLDRAEEIERNKAFREDKQ